MKMPIGKRKVGRPTKYQSEMCAVVIEVGKRGDTLVSMACELNIRRETLHAWRQENPEFSNAINEALQYSQNWWETKARNATFENLPMNPTSFIFNMKNRFREDWRDRHETDHMSTDGSMSVGKIEREIIDPKD